MGSGHFLLRACQYLAEEIAANAFSGDVAGATGGDEESTLTFWKRSVAEHCIYGVDANSLAVELAKLALWLDTVAKDKPLTYLDHHLQAGNSLVGTPIGEINHAPGERPLLREAVEKQIEEVLPTLLEPLSEIEALPSDTTEHVKAKDRLRKLFVDRRESFRMVAGLMVRHAVLAWRRCCNWRPIQCSDSAARAASRIAPSDKEGGHRACIGACAVAGCPVLALGIGVS